MGFSIKEGLPSYKLTWWDKKGQSIEVDAPTKDEAKELLQWLATYTGMKT